MSTDIVIHQKPAQNDNTNFYAKKNDFMMWNESLVASFSTVYLCIREVVLG